MVSLRSEEVFYLCRKPVPVPPHSEAASHRGCLLSSGRAAAKKLYCIDKSCQIGKRKGDKALVGSTKARASASGAVPFDPNGPAWTLPLRPASLWVAGTATAEPATNIVVAGPKTR